ncbi:GW dipeptide domain-containing protein [Terribacillus sp. 179-K 1B1 HS]|uniref:GW dipeptide domain-containing protein n=1 Tax=Terribacillus sp. 179-K 1B1 HS TaxID=3142388 RepID=UPI0039A2009A
MKKVIYLLIAILVFSTLSPANLVLAAKSGDETVGSEVSIDNPSSELQSPGEEGETEEQSDQEGTTVEVDGSEAAAKQESSNSSESGKASSSDPATSTEPNTQESTSSEKQQDEQSAEQSVEKEEAGKTMRAASVAAPVESALDRIGHLNGNAVIYPNLTDTSNSIDAEAAGYTNIVYYLKKQAKWNNVTYYLISKQPSATDGVVGWVKASDMDTRNYGGKSVQQATFTIKGTGNAYTKPWGGKKDLVYTLKNYKGELFKADYSEKVGDKTYYHGTLAGKKVNIDAEYLTSYEDSKTSRLGHLNANAKIYDDINSLTTWKDAEDANLTNAVYYIKKQAIVNGTLYYLLSKQPSSTKNLVGWVKASDMDTRSHVTTDKKAKTFVVKGTNNAYTKAWGGKKDIVFDLSSKKGQLFQVHLTEQVGNKTWYRGMLAGKEVFIEASYLETYQEEKTSILGHLNGDAVIHPELDNFSKSIGAAKEGYTNAVYYIKKQAKVGNVLYYLISKQPSSKKGLVGWVKASDMDAHPHVTTDKDAKTLAVKGSGKAYTKAWGGKKDVVYSDLSSKKGQPLIVNLTEKVGDVTWYRGMLAGKEVFIKSSDLEAYKPVVKEERTSILGHLNGDAVIYPDLNNPAKSIGAAKEGYTNAVYYIKKQAKIGNVLYYLISKQPSSKNGLVGWVKASDMDAHPHVTTDKEAKTLVVKGSGKAYTKAWGGKKDLVFDDLSSKKGQLLQVNLTEKVGDNTWYRGMLAGKEVFIHSTYLEAYKPDIQEERTSLLGHLNGDAVIYPDLNNPTRTIGADKEGYTYAVYYIKKQAKVEDELYYLISKQPSSKKGLVGWVKASDMDTNPHVTTDKEAKSFVVNGNGFAYTKAWGGNKDKVFDLSTLKGQLMQVNLTEKVGSNTWHRGMLNGKEVFINGKYLTPYEESKTSRLGHLNANAKIYEELSNLSAWKDAEDANLTHSVYYIKKQVKIGNALYYLISTQPSSKKGLVGWVNANDMDTHSHITIDKNSKIYYSNGKGKSYTKAWGGKKDMVESNMSSYKGQEFSVNLTEKVGDDIWYRGVLNGKEMWLHEDYVAVSYEQKQNYDLTLQEAISIQQKASPQTDKEYDTYVSAQYIKNNTVTADLLNVRGGPSTNYWVVGTLKNGAKVNIIRQVGSWYQIEFTNTRQWVNPAPTDIEYYLNPDNFIHDDRQRFQFLDLTRSSDATVETLNKYLKGKGTLEGQGQAFLDASKLYGINDIYLVSHSTLETGNGKSQLAQGVDYKGTTVYNMYGVGAYDSCAVQCGAERAYKEGWTTPYKAIVGGAKYIGEGYINSGQNTLYKMRWNPQAMADTGKYGKQYATDIGWAYKQVNTMYNLYQTMGLYTLYMEIPSYK